MIPRLGELGKFFLRNQQAGRAFMNALEKHSGAFHRGERVYFTFFVQEGDKVVEKQTFVQKITALMK
jgi:hypothetical protein